MTIATGDAALEVMLKAREAFDAMPRGKMTCEQCPIRAGCPHQAAGQDWKDCHYGGGPLTRKRMIDMRTGGRREV